MEKGYGTHHRPAFRDSIHVEAYCVSLLGGIQPGRLRSNLIDALRDGPSHDGLIQRFQLLVWPRRSKESAQWVWMGVRLLT
jgi:Protein of unknown function (DUF3987)